MLDRSSICSEKRSLIRTRRWQEEVRSFVRRFGGKMTLNQLLVLCSITLSHFEQRRCTVQAISDSEHICQPTVSGCVRRLEAYGLVESVPAPEDGRVRLLRLTDRAIALRAETHQEIIAKNLEAI